MAEHTLAILVKAVGTAQAAKKLKGVDAVVSNIGAHVGKGLRTAASNMLKLGAAAGAIAAGIGVIAIKSGVQSLATLESAVTSVDGALKTMGKTGGITGANVAAWANAIESDIGAAFDDKDITAATANLIRFGKVTSANLRPAMVVMTDLAVKTGSVEAASSLLGKALADPAKAAGKLSRVGVVLTKGQQDQIKAFMKAGKVGRAQKVILDALSKSTKGAAEASQGPYQRAMSTFADVTEDAQRALAEGFLPVITRAADWLKTKLADPATLTSIRNIGDNLAGAFDQALDFVEGVDWASLGQGLKVAADWAGKLFGAFMSLPPEVKGTILALAGLNKLSGGAVSGIVGELGKGLIKGVLGMTAGVVNINAAVVNGAGGKPGVTPDLPGKSGLGGVVKSLPVVSTIILLNDLKPGRFEPNRNRMPRKGSTSDDPTGFKNSGQMQTLLKTAGDTHSEQIMTNKAVAAVETKQAESLIAFRAGERATQTAGTVTSAAARSAGMVSAMASMAGASRIVSAVQSAGKPIVNVYVSVPGASVRYGSGSSRDRGTGRGP